MNPVYKAVFAFTLSIFFLGSTLYAQPCAYSDILGTWSGTVTQGSSMYDMTITIDCNTNPVSYDIAAGCEGTWAYSSTTSSTHDFVETITSGPCVGTVYVEATLLPGDQLDVKLKLSPTASPVAVATLDLEVSPSVPTMGQWGLIILALLMLTAGTVKIRRRQIA